MAPSPSLLVILNFAALTSLLELLLSTSAVIVAPVTSPDELLLLEFFADTTIPVAFIFATEVSALAFIAIAELAPL